MCHLASESSREAPRPNPAHMSPSGSTGRPVNLPAWHDQAGSIGKHPGQEENRSSGPPRAGNGHSPENSNHRLREGQPRPTSGPAQRHQIRSGEPQHLVSVTTTVEQGIELLWIRQRAPGRGLRLSVETADWQSARRIRHRRAMRRGISPASRAINGNINASLVATMLRTRDQAAALPGGNSSTRHQPGEQSEAKHDAGTRPKRRKAARHDAN